MKKITPVNVLDGIAAVLFVSSFFVSDNKKAVKMRWAALGSFAVARGVVMYQGYQGAK